MIRPILTEALLFLAPFAIYAAYLLASRNNVFDSSSWNARTVGILTVVALVLLFGGLVMLAQWSGQPAGSHYVPPHMEDGKLIPGHFK